MPPAGRSPDALRAAKEARQKKLLLVLAPVLLALLAWQGPGILKAFTGGDAAPEPTSQEAQPSSTGAGADSVGEDASATTADEPAGSPNGATKLPDTDVPPPAGSGQLVAFDRFVGKDPFRQQVTADAGGAGETGAPAPAEGSTGGGSTGGSSTGGAAAGGGSTGATPTGGGSTGAGGTGAGATGGGSTGGGSTGGGSPSHPIAEPVEGGGAGGGGETTSGRALLEVNGVREAVAVGASFPASAPLFRLVSIRGRTARIGLVDGRFTDGSGTITLRVGESVTLVSRPEGLRYTIKLLRVSTAGGTTPALTGRR